MTTEQRVRKPTRTPQRPDRQERPVKKVSSPQRSLKTPTGKPTRERTVTRPSQRTEAPPKKPKRPEPTSRVKTGKPQATIADTAILPEAPSADVMADSISQLRALANGIYTVEMPDRFRRALRPSGLPYCPILDATKNEPATYKQSFYLDIGTAFHEIVQTFVCRSGIARSMVYANFKCMRCETVELFKPLPKTCFTCGAGDHFFQYVELEFEQFRGLGGGHVDLFVKTSNGWLVCDWKTTSEKSLKFREDVDDKHHHQLQAYCLALAELFSDKLQGLPILGYVLMFAPRDQPGKFVRKKLGTKMAVANVPGDDMITNWELMAHPFHAKIAEDTRKRLRRAKRAFDALTDAYRERTPEAWHEVARLRPCRSIADFNKPMGMADGFYKRQLCPKIDICMGTTSSVARWLARNAVDRDN